MQHPPNQPSLHMRNRENVNGAISKQMIKGKPAAEMQYTHSHTRPCSTEEEKKVGFHEGERERERETEREKIIFSAAHMN